MLRIFFLLFTVLANYPLLAFERVNDVSVLAVEYPPFTTDSHSEGGIAFKLLNDTTSNKNIKWSPLFLPPKRVYKTIESGDWCASFYPVFGQNNFTQYELGKDSIKIGLVRLSKPIPFAFSSLDELKGKVVALLRTGEKSEFSMQFKNAGVDIIYVENIQTAIKMVLRKRVDIAMIDNISYANLDPIHKNKLQFSKESLHETKVSVFINNSCGIPLLNLKVLNLRQSID